MNRIAMLVAAGLLVAACGTTATPAPKPDPTPQVVRVEIPGPTVTIERTPSVCIQALHLNAQAWAMEGQFLGWAVNDTGTWTQADDANFSDLVDAFAEARDACLATAEQGVGS